MPEKRRFQFYRYFKDVNFLIVLYKHLIAQLVHFNFELNALQN
jgi:hypothetical protein